MSASRDPGTPHEDTTVRPATPPPIAPPLPVAKRLNRNALTVVAVLMGITVLVAVVTLNTTRPTTATAPDATAPASTATQPSFLDLPARRDPTVPPLVAAGIPQPDTMPPTWPAQARIGPPTTPYMNPYALPPAPAPVDLAAEAYQRALVSPVVTTVLPTLTAPGRQASAEAITTAQAAPSLDTLDTTHRRMTPPESGPASSYRLDATTVIPAALLRAINSDLPGQVVAQVTRHVYDSRTLRTLLIPQGTKLIGRYDTDITAGQHRLQITWTRLIFPDGRRLTVPGSATTDAQGATGIPGQVNNHQRRIFGTALLTSVISAAVQLSQPQPSVGAAPNARQVAAGALGQELSTVGLEVLRRNLDLRPTITLPEGTAINVMLSGDLEMPAPAQPIPFRDW